MSLLNRPKTICGEMKVTDAPMMDRLNFTLGGSTNVNVIADKIGSWPVSGPSTTRSVPVPHTHYDPSQTWTPSHVLKSSESEALRNVVESQLFQCVLARSRALKQLTWGPCLTRTVLSQPAGLPRAAELTVELELF